MADYPISNVARRVVYTGSAGVGPYAFSFEVLQNTDIVVYKNNTLLTLTSDYTVSISPTLGTGSVTLTSAATGSDRITIVGARAVQRTTDFTTGGDFFANTLNDELDSQTIFIQQVAETSERAIKAPVTDPTNINMTLPKNTDRANKTLVFDANGNPSIGQLLGKFRGDWATATSYIVYDYVVDPVNKNVYVCNTAHTSTGSAPIKTNANASRWDLIVDAEAAATSATNAANSATAAASSASSASTSATNANTSRTNAATSATNAASSATAAASSASSAATSATNAANSATSASTSATNAASSATSASSSASSASSSASSASSSASAASGSASSAATSATNAANSATSAASSYDQFDDRYLGAKSSAPSVDNDGNALLTGALYWNSTENKMYSWSGSAWVLITGPGTGTVTSVGMTVPTGLTVSGSPITASGTLAVSYSAGYSLPTTTKQSNWDDSYTFTSNFPTQTGNSGKYLTTDGSTLSWATVAGGSSNLDGLTDVVITSPITGQVLKYNGTNWINDTDSTGAGSFAYPLGTGIVTVSSGSAWGTTISAPTGAIVGTSDTQTLTNKTISGASNTLSNIGNASLTNSSITINGTLVSLGGSASVGTLTSITAGTGLTGGTITGSGTVAIDSTVVATLSGTQTLSNKTISVDDNSISGIAASSFVLSNSSGNIDGVAAQKAIPAGVVVGTTDTQTLTNKTLTSPVISTIVNTGTLTLPTATDTLVGRATTDTLTNKTLTSPRVGTAVLDTNGNEVFAITATASAVNDFILVNAATGNAPQIQATGSDTNISLNLVAKGTGTVQANGVTVVTTSGTQTLTNKSLTSPTLTTATTSGKFSLGGSIDETVFAVTGTTPALSPANGTIQTWTLSANSTPTQGTWDAGESMTLMVNDTASVFTVTWTSMPVVWVGGSAPALTPGGGFTVIELWKVGTTLYGALVGQVA